MGGDEGRCISVVLTMLRFLCGCHATSFQWRSVLFQCRPAGLDRGWLHSVCDNFTLAHHMSYTVEVPALAKNMTILMVARDRKLSALLAV